MKVDKTNKEEVQNLDTVLGMEVGEVVEGEGEGAGFLTQESDVGWTTLVDTYNRFNELIRLVILWEVQHLWPEG